MLYNSLDSPSEIHFTLLSDGDERDHESGGPAEAAGRAGGSPVGREGRHHSAEGGERFANMYIFEDSSGAVAICSF